MTTTTAPDPSTREDDGHFGPDSVSWRLYADPSSKLGGVAALLMQALRADMMHLFSAGSTYESDPQARAERTGRYIDTTVFGDRRHADAAASAVRRMHARIEGVDPYSGRTMRADTPEWLEWTHNSLVWCVLRAADEFGPRLPRALQDRFVVEQHLAAEFVGIDPTRLPTTRAELDTAIDAEQERCSLGLDAARLTRELRAPRLRGNPVTVISSVIIQDGILHLLPDWARLLYGIEGRPMSTRAAATTTRRLLRAARRNRSYEQVITDLTTRVDTHPYRRAGNR